MLNLSKKFSNLPICYLAPYGRGGSVFIQGIFDGHPQVLQIPTFFQFVELYRQTPKTTFINCKNKIKEELCSKYEISVNFKKLEKEYFRYLKYHNSENQKEAQFRAIHYAWAIERGYCIDDIKIILWHPHRLDTSYVKFFSSIKNKKIILCCRSQVSSLISTYKHWTDSDALFMPSAKATIHFKHPWILMYLVSTCETYEFYKKFKKNSFYLKIESVNDAPEYEIKKLCNNLEVKYIPKIMKTSTCLNKPMLQRAGKAVKGYSKTKHYDQEELDILTEAISGYLFNAAAREFGYNNINTNSFTKAEILKKIIFSDIWVQSFRICCVEGIRRTTNKKNHLFKILRTIKYYAQFLKYLCLFSHYLLRASNYKHG